MTNVASAPLLQVDAITMRFGGIVAIDNLSLDVKQGQILALMGPNGAGKTTTFHVIAGVHKPTSGRILFQGQDITAMRPDGRCRAGVARTFQITQPFEQLSVTENIMVGARPFHHSMAELRKASEAFADQVGLGDKLDTPAKGLSTGQRKRLELARAMATRPKLLLMDEVTGGVDMKSIPGLIELVKSLRRGGLTIVLIEHNMKVINDLADEAIFMNRGARMVSGTPYQVATDPAVVELYLGEAKADDH
ncbi:MAG TPA: ABC transporter ATP-binding protein [Paracoccus solventivorans]|uniref:ABC transporter ATP-binding protein n=1 Tax=Paracoccus solventivorans TaxID=53463 RepID=UPI002D085779|nr:ABC transporter ATP-binding protein [Paracoccus solventivorans]HMM07703.1 ABC transporter ATP-binding protein [Paracoccus solventivorans]